MAAAVSLWDIFSKVRWESFAWGAGTALGELPPYFVARAGKEEEEERNDGSGETTEMRLLIMKILVALSGGKSEELADFEAGLEKSAEQRTFKEQLTYWVYHGMKRLGFFGILFFASIPNPLFDLAGIICGNFLVPFATFFGATFLGKACIKASLQVSIEEDMGIMDISIHLDFIVVFDCHPCIFQRHVKRIPVDLAKEGTSHPCHC